jgi:hypothetical protein
MKTADYEPLLSRCETAAPERESARVDVPLRTKPLNLYLIGTRMANFLKLGVTEDVEARLCGLQTACPFPLHIIWTKKMEPKPPYPEAPPIFFKPRRWAMGMESLMAKEGMRMGYWKHAHREWFAFTKPLRKERSIDSEIQKHMEDLYAYIIKEGKKCRSYSGWFQNDSRRVFKRDA